MINFYNIDNLEFMKDIPDSYYDLAIVDPPYGLGIDGQKESKSRNPKHNRKKHDKKGWDKNIPPKEYFKELFRVSKNQIIWGGNYFVEHLKEGHKGWIVWDKKQHGLTMSDCELAYSIFDCPTRVYYKNRSVLIEQKTIHPTEKPIHLYEWLIINYAEKEYKILDTHGGSMAISIAVNNVNNKNKMNLSLDICEIDKDYFDKGIERFNSHISQTTIFDYI